MRIENVNANARSSGDGPSWKDDAGPLPRTLNIDPAAQITEGAVGDATCVNVNANVNTNANAIENVNANGNAMTKAKGKLAGARSLSRDLLARPASSTGHATTSSKGSTRWDYGMRAKCECECEMRV